MFQEGLGNGYKPVKRQAINIPVNKLAHNIPVDRAHVQTLKTSILELGQLSPIILWGKNNSIIDGFHRVDALCELKVEYVAANVVECTLEQFRDARITSAVLHKGVTFSRIVDWANEVFSETSWAKQIRAAEAFHLERRSKFPGGYQRLLRDGFQSQEIKEIIDWIRLKSKTWGLKTEQIANILNLADLASPKLILVVRNRQQPREEVLTRAMLKTIVSQIPDHCSQEAIAGKAQAERLNERETQELVREFLHSKSSESQQTLLSTSWIDIKRKEAAYRQQESEKLTMEEVMEKREDFNIKMLIGLVNDVADRIDLYRKDIEKHPDLEPHFDRAISNLLLSIAEYRGEDINTIRILESEIQSINRQNESLMAQNQALSIRLARLQRTMGIATDIEASYKSNRD